MLAIIQDNPDFLCKCERVYGSNNKLSKNIGAHVSANVPWMLSIECIFCLFIDSMQDNITLYRMFHFSAHFQSRLCKILSIVF